MALSAHVLTRADILLLYFLGSLETKTMPYHKERPWWPEPLSLVERKKFKHSKKVDRARQGCLRLKCVCIGTLKETPRQQFVWTHYCHDQGQFGGKVIMSKKIENPAYKPKPQNDIRIKGLEDPNDFFKKSDEVFPSAINGALLIEFQVINEHQLASKYLANLSGDARKVNITGTIPHDSAFSRICPEFYETRIRA